MMPKRIQRKRTKGWRMPENCVSITRPSIWANPFVIGKPCGIFPASMGMHGKAEVLIPELSREQSLEMYKRMVNGCLSPEMYPSGHNWYRRIQKKFRNNAHPAEVMRWHLAGKDLACFCSLDVSCHVDIALEVANRR